MITDNSCASDPSCLSRVVAAETGRRSGAVGGFWFGGQGPPSDRLTRRLQDEEARVHEAYALQAGRERGAMASQIEALRDKLAMIARGPEWTEKRSSGSALRRALRRYPRDPGPCLDALEELGELLGEDDDVLQWLHGDDGARDLSTLWRPRPASLIEQVLASPAAAAAWVAGRLSPAQGGSIRILVHGLGGVSPTTRRLLAESSIAAFWLDGDVHLFDDMTEYLAIWEQSRAVDMEVSPLTLRDTLLLHELVEMSVAHSDGLGVVTAHVVATVVERMVGRAVELAEATNVYFAEQREAAGLEPVKTPRRRATDATDQIPVLIVDDSSISRHVVTMLLRRLGHRVIEAVSGAEAITCAEQQNPRLIVLDLGLPDMAGLTALAQIRQLSGHGDTPTIILTADRQTESILEARRLGVVDYLTKPLDTKDMAGRVQRHLGPG